MLYLGWWRLFLLLWWISRDEVRFLWIFKNVVLDFFRDDLNLWLVQPELLDHFFSNSFWCIRWNIKIKSNIFTSNIDLHLYHFILRCAFSFGFRNLFTTWLLRSLSWVSFLNGLHWIQLISGRGRCSNLLDLLVVIDDLLWF